MEGESSDDAAKTALIGRAQIYTFAWIFGFFASMLIYYVICTWVSPPTESMVDEAIYPPGKEDVETGRPEDISEKQMTAEVKEVDSP